MNPAPGHAPNAGDVRGMFARIAQRYDRANRLLSLGIDRSWRRAAVRAAAIGPTSHVLDVCAGTGDVSFALAATGATVIGSDFCPEMLERAVAKGAGRGAPSPQFLAGDAMRLPFPDAHFDAVTVAFGIRNVADPVAALAEMARVGKPGARLVVLEFTRPRTPIVGPLFLFYFRRVLPRLGAWITRDSGAYRYLPESVLRFPEREEFVELMRQAGLQEPAYQLLSGGVCAVYRALAGPGRESPRVRSR
ncbi:MAG: bifunctional demethylmenaquinone methyltransferase/2-methoxy-6-polyprenyl-1,4-benzoquinol methylase UbiE [Planctomycetota bacterium]